MNTAKPGPMLEGRQADSARRRQRVIAALDRAAADGSETSTSGIARAAGVDRTFLYRHRDLLEKIHALQAEPATGDSAGPAVTRASLQADLLAAHERAVRLNARIQHLEKRLSEALGDQAWRESGLGAPADIDALGHLAAAAGLRPGRDRHPGMETGHRAARRRPDHRFPALAGNQPRLQPGHP